MSAPATATLSVLDMPLPGTRQAPRRFNGDYRYVNDFIEHYERLLHRYNVTTPEDQCKSIRQYCSSKVRETIEGMNDYATPNWTQLKATILKFYDAERNEQRYTERDLISFIRISRDETIASVNKFRVYQRNFYRIAGWLHSKGKLTDVQVKQYFWRGLPKKLRHGLEARLLMTHPTHDMTKPFDISQIVTAVEQIFMRTRFDVDDSDNEIDVDWPESPSDSEDESGDDSDADFQRRPTAKTKSRSKPKPAQLEQASKEKSRKLVNADKSRTILRELEKEGTEAKKQDEIESLIKQMGQMSLEDPNYGLLYYRAITMDPRVEKIVRPPQFSNASSNRRNQPHQGTGPRPAFECFGCGGKDHSMNACPALNELMNNGVIKRGPDGKYTMHNGSRIFRNFGETLVQAAQRIQSSIVPQQAANFVTTTTHDTAMSSSEEDDIGEEVYAADRPTKSTREKRTELEGVFVPSKSTRTKGKEPDTAGAPRSRPVQDRPAPRAGPSKTIPVVVPMDIISQTQTFDPDDDDEIMEDAPATKAKAPKKPRLPHASTVSKAVDPNAILNKALNAPITLTVKEIIGVSKEISTLMQDAIRYRRPIQSAEVANFTGGNGVNHSQAHAISLPQGVLIKVPMEIDGMKIQAIIDTGSTLNIIHQQMSKMIRRPVNRTITPVMNDANGGGKLMAGLMENVPLMCGSVLTHADLFVAGHVPFDLLLGRPWQRGNLVSIEERTDGTYILFKDPKDPGVYHELLGVPETISQRFNYHTWETTEGILPGDSAIFNPKDKPCLMITEEPPQYPPSPTYSPSMLSFNDGSWSQYLQRNIWNDHGLEHDSTMKALSQVISLTPDLMTFIRDEIQDINASQEDSTSERWQREQSEMDEYEVSGTLPPSVAQPQDTNDLTDEASCLAMTPFQGPSSKIEDPFYDSPLPYFLKSEPAACKGSIPIHYDPLCTVKGGHIAVHHLTPDGGGSLNGISYHDFTAYGAEIQLMEDDGLCIQTKTMTGTVFIRFCEDSRWGTSKTKDSVNQDATYLVDDALMDSFTGDYIDIFGVHPNFLQDSDPDQSMLYPSLISEDHTEPMHFDDTADALDCSFQSNDSLLGEMDRIEAGEGNLDETDLCLLTFQEIEESVTRWKDSLNEETDSSWLFQG